MYVFCKPTRGATNHKVRDTKYRMHRPTGGAENAGPENARPKMQAMFAYRRVKHGDFCCFKGVTYFALTLCFKLRSFFALI